MLTRRAFSCGGLSVRRYKPRFTVCTRTVPSFITASKQVSKYIHPFNGPLSRTTWLSQYQRSKTNLDFTKARDSEWQWHQLGHMLVCTSLQRYQWQWHQLGHMHVCTSLQTDNHASTPPLSFFTDWMPFLPPNQQRQSTEGKV